MIRNPFTPASSNSHGTLLIKSALELVIGGRVSQVKIDKPSFNALNISARVLEKQKVPYRTHLQFELDKSGEMIAFNSYCNCYAYSECKHAAAILIALLQREERTELPPKVERWFGDVNLNQDSKSPDDLLIHYQLSFPNALSEKAEVRIFSHKVLEAGHLQKGEIFSLDGDAVSLVSNPIDEQIINRLRQQALHKESLVGSEHYLLSSDLVLQALMQSGRCFSKEAPQKAIRLGATKEAILYWEVQKDGSQLMKARTNEGHDQVFLVEQPFYFNQEELVVGNLSLPLDPKIVNTLLLSPAIPVEKVKAVSDKLKPLIGANFLPKTITIKSVLKNITPSMKVYFKTFEVFESQKSTLAYQVNGQVIGLRVSFQYNDYPVGLHLGGQKSKLLVMENGELFEIERDYPQEEQAFLQLKQYLLLKPLSGLYQIKSSVSDRQQYFLVSNEWLTRDSEAFLEEGIPKLQEFGIQYSIEALKFHQVYVAEEGQWLSEVVPSGENFFQYELGILFDNKKINVLPLLLDLLKKYDLSELLVLEDTLPLTLNVDKHTKLKVPLGRLKSMLTIFGEIIQKQLSKAEPHLTLSSAQASLLYEMEQAKNMVALRWLDDHKFRQLGKKLSDFTEIEPVDPPLNFNAKLRDYQLFGLSWLQFLRQYQFGGVLADEMGLGKTIQTLAHLSLEKNAKRLNRPCLIVAPTSLMGNWALECERFAPNLSYLIHHGDKREKNVTLSDYDIVFTTYALIARDKGLFLESDFYYLILDEAQNIKNAATKTTQILLQFKAEHRLCLTGTPIENHLGELWSLFNFLMPGYLLDKNSFNKEFRHSIEKEGDENKQALLRQKIKPFLLRRVKKEVAMELPEKTESIISVELTGRQREIYESIRLSMQEKVRNALMLNGLNRSHIVILDALLRLRQTCCSPRLLKMDEAHDANSDKVQALFELLPILIEEGRKILLFSQFTSMIELLEKEMESRDISYVTLTGKTKNREKVIETFRNTTIPVFLISLKAGGTGLNLTEADTVIHFDPWWNPQVENQATDRSHRIGQTKPVFVYKLICKDTVEEVMLSMQAKKSALVDNLLTLSKGESLKLTLDDVNALFNIQSPATS